MSSEGVFDFDGVKKAAAEGSPLICGERDREE